jgi:dihydroorotase
LEGLADGTIDAIATDHAPHSAEEKAKPFGSAPNGIVGFETLLAGSLTALYHSGHMTLSDTLRLMTCSPASILRIDAGRLAPGTRADLVLFSPDEEWIPEPEKFLSKSKNSPFGGMKLRGRVKYTVSGGKIVYSCGK